MGSDEMKNALRNANEVELIVTGRKSGNQTSRPIWFVEEDDKILLLPVSGSDSNWYRNIRANPEIRLAADGADYAAQAELVEDPGAVDHVLQAFGAKYGADRVNEYYPKHDVAVEVPLS
jgi:deazaflavin-dependent oxidoreductase (nitroreductase family)